jgi:Cu2+-containing amine oxidase
MSRASRITPVMSTAKLSVAFRPDGFFACNPALGLGGVDRRP